MKNKNNLDLYIILCALSLEDMEISGPISAIDLCQGLYKTEYILRFTVS